MVITELSGPAAEPLTLAEAKNHSRVDDDGQDSVIERCIAAARASVERYLRKRLITQQVRLTLDGFGGGWSKATRLSVAPIQSVDQVEYLDAAGSWQTLAPERYRLIGSAIPPELWPEYGESWPTPRPDVATVRIDLTVGYGDTGSDVPPDIRQAVALLAGHYFEHREAVISGTTAAQIPLGVRDMLSAHRLWV